MWFHTRFCLVLGDDPVLLAGLKPSRWSIEDLRLALAWTLPGGSFVVPFGVAYYDH